METSDVRSRVLAATLLLAATAFAAVLPAWPAQAAAPVGCEDGVTVVVDFSAFGGGVDLRCAAGDPASALAALGAAGFSWSSTLLSTSATGGPVCRIDNLPAPDDESCLTPADAGWTHWYAARGGSWSRSGSSPGSWDPAPGGVEGWAFGSGPPGVAPPPLPPPPPPPAPTATAGAPSTAPGSPPTPAGSTAPGKAGLGGTSARTTVPGAVAIPDDGTPAGPTPTPSGSATPSPSPAPSGSPVLGAGLPPGAADQPEAAAARPVSRTDEALRVVTGGSPAGVIGGGLLVASLAAAGVLLGRRRSAQPWVWSLDRADRAR